MKAIKTRIRTSTADIISDYVQNVIDDLYNKDNCKPTFIISQMDNDIVLTITHLGWSQSEKIWLGTDIKELVVTLYNRTM